MLNKSFLGSIFRKRKKGIPLLFRANAAGMVKMYQNPTRAQRNLCKNEECKNIRRAASAYCQECSDKHNAM